MAADGQPAGQPDLAELVYRRLEGSEAMRQAQGVLQAAAVDELRGVRPQMPEPPPENVLIHALIDEYLEYNRLNACRSLLETETGWRAGAGLGRPVVAHELGLAEGAAGRRDGAGRPVPLIYEAVQLLSCLRAARAASRRGDAALVARAARSGGTARPLCLGAVARRAFSEAREEPFVAVSTVQETSGRFRNEPRERWFWEWRGTFHEHNLKMFECETPAAVAAYYLENCASLHPINLVFAANRICVLDTDGACGPDMEPIFAGIDKWIHNYWQRLSPREMACILFIYARYRRKPRQFLLRKAIAHIEAATLRLTRADPRTPLFRPPPDDDRLRRTAFSAISGASGADVGAELANAAWAMGTWRLSCPVTTARIALEAMQASGADVLSLDPSRVDAVDLPLAESGAQAAAAAAPAEPDEVEASEAALSVRVPLAVHDLKLLFHFVDTPLHGAAVPSVPETPRRRRNRIAEPLEAPRRGEAALAVGDWLSADAIRIARAAGWRIEELSYADYAMAEPEERGARLVELANRVAMQCRAAEARLQARARGGAALPEIL
ncbi:hypothetical protein FNF28_01579 [Cafeteria roenbergensis]|uniref:LisH domain-containing protein n=1 Tax=Cafeteria roenbergensis TaxID=33653 RepID=A0A5A8DY65_CAFRO|nr:hypothetical protein FNF28_01579 [Cafeteria roenbergensis]